DLLTGVDNAAAGEHLRRALQGNLRPSEAAYARGLLATRVDDALRHFREAVAHDRFHHDARAFVGFLSVIVGQLQEAREWLDQCLLLYPDDSQFHLLMAMCLEIRADGAAAEPYWQRVAEVAPADDIRIIRHTLSLLPKLRILLESSSGL